MDKKTLRNIAMCDSVFSQTILRLRPDGHFLLHTAASDWWYFVWVSVQKEGREADKTRGL